MKSARKFFQTASAEPSSVASQDGADRRTSTGVHTCLSARNLSRPACAIDASNRRTVGGRVPGYIKVGRLAGLGGQPRLGREGKPCDREEWCLCFLPFDTRIFDPEARVPAFAPVGHLSGVEELEAEVEAAHRVVLVDDDSSCSGGGEPY
jgi:hypothetical protein